MATPILPEVRSYTAVATEPSQHEDTPEGQSKPITCSPTP